MTDGQQPHRGRKKGGAREGVDSAEQLAEQLADVLRPASAIVCIGNELRGDDGAGTAVARELGGALPWQVFDTQTVPESFLMKIAAQEPDSVVLIDALDFGGAPGAVNLARADDIGGQGPSTHGPTPLAFLEALRMVHPCPCWVLGIQPEHIEFGVSLSAAVEAAVELVVRAFHLLAEPLKETDETP